MIKSYMLKLAGIIVVGSAAGITNWAIQPPLKLHLDEMDEASGTVVLPTQPKQNQPKQAQPERPESDPVNEFDESDAPEVVLEPETSTTIVLKREITLDQARMLFENGLADFVDARPAKEFEDGHILGAYNVAPDAFTRGTPAVIDFFEEDRRIVVYCSGGDCHDSHVVVEQMMLIRPELTLMHVFVDGYPAWTDAGLPTDIGPDPLAE